MKIKRKALLIVGLLVLIIFSSGMTYSIFTSGTNIDVSNQKIAKFIFNAEKLDHLELNLVDLNPGDKETYSFEVSNSSETTLSNVTIQYQIVIKTLHLIPLNIKLYKKAGKERLEVLSCDETFSRNDKNELVCNTSTQKMPFSMEEIDSYELEVEFPSLYVDDIYSNLVDYIDLEIKSWQKVS